MGKPERHCQVDVEVNPVPGLVRKEGACGANGDKCNEHEEADRHGSAEATILTQREVNDPIKDLPRSCNAVARDKGGGRGERVHHEEPDRGEAGESVQPCRLIASNHLIDPRGA